MGVPATTGISFLGAGSAEDDAVATSICGRERVATYVGTDESFAISRRLAWTLGPGV